MRQILAARQAGVEHDHRDVLLLEQRRGERRFRRRCDDHEPGRHPIRERDRVANIVFVVDARDERRALFDDRDERFERKALFPGGPAPDALRASADVAFAYARASSSSRATRSSSASRSFFRSS
jgi:hypothetical protein